MRRVTLFLSVIAALMITTLIIPGQHIEAGGLSVPTDDFIVNTDTSGGCPQFDPWLCVSGTGNAVAVWIDRRQVGKAIYGQRFDPEHNPIGTNFKVTETMSETISWPCVAVSDSGNFVVAWEEQKDDTSQVYAQLYKEDGRRIGPSFLVSEEETWGTPLYLSVAMDADGDFALCWYDSRLQDRRILYKTYNSAGEATGMLRSVPMPPGESGREPYVSCDGRGNYYIAWRGSDGSIYGSPFDSTGAPLSDPILLNRPYPDMSVRNHHIAMNREGDLVVAWLSRDYAKADYNVYVRVMSKDGVFLCDNVLASNATLNRGTTTPVVAIDSAGRFTVCWHDFEDGHYYLAMQKFDSDGHAIGQNMMVDDGPESIAQRDPAIGCDSEGNAFICWYGSRGVASDIYGKVLPGESGDNGSRFLINDDVATSYQQDCDVAASESGQFVVVWEDARGYPINCYGQRVDFAGNLLGDNFRISDSESPSAASVSPCVAADAAGNFVVAWRDIRTDGTNIYSQRYGSDGSPIGPNSVVNDMPYGYYPGQVDIAMSDSGEHVVVWSSGPDENADIFAKKYGSSGDPITSQFLVNGFLAGRQIYPSVGISASGDFVVAWLDDSSSSVDRFIFQLYDSTGAAIGSNHIMDIPDLTTYTGPRVSMDDSGAFVIAWFSTGSRGYSTFVQRFNPLGNPVGEIMEAANHLEPGSDYMPQIASDVAGNFVVTWWLDRTYEDNVLAQIFDSDGNAVGSNWSINASHSDLLQARPSVAVTDSHICFAWQDNRRAKGWDIYARLTNWTPIMSVCGDANSSGSVDIDDVITLIGYIFGVGEAPVRPESGDANNSGFIDIDDVVYLINYIFNGGN